MKRTILAIFLTLPLMAQVPRFTFNVGGGFTQPLDRLSDRLETGWNATAGAGVNITPAFGMIFDFHYSGHAIQARVLNDLRVPDGNLRFWSVTLNPRISFDRGEGAVGAYITGGGGIYNRRLQFTEPTLAPALICDFYWGLCYDGVVPAQSIIGEFSTYKGGVNAGGGLTFKIGANTKLYAEARWHRMFTRNDSTFIPVSFGLRW